MLTKLIKIQGSLIKELRNNGAGSIECMAVSTWYGCHGLHVPKWAMGSIDRVHPFYTNMFFVPSTTTPFMVFSVTIVIVSLTTLRLMLGYTNDYQLHH